jgi:transcriptional regulator with XRE-family HTH domain
MTDTPDPIDVHVGQRIRMQRRTVGMSQEALASALNLTFQQVQKYERGTNRVSASKLYRAAQILGVPVGFFFEGLEADEGAEQPDHTEASGRLAQALLSADYGRAIAEWFPRIRERRLQKAASELVRSLAEPDTGEGSGDIVPMRRKR